MERFFSLLCTAVLILSGIGAFFLWHGPASVRPITAHSKHLQSTTGGAAESVTGSAGVESQKSVPAGQLGQGPGGRGGRGRGRGRRRATPTRDSLPTWSNDSAFPHDVFTFVRIQFDSFGPFGWHDRWDNDYPDGDWNLSLRLQQATSLNVHPDGKVLRLSDEALLDYPFAYFAGVQYMALSETERAGFRRYLENGGFFMMDDLWGLESLATVTREMEQVLPGCEAVELSLNHPIFHIVYDLKELPQVTDFQTWQSGSRYEFGHAGQSGDAQPHFLGYFDSNRRLVGLVCHNNDIGDGWEREGENHDYFEAFSLKYSYPLGINIITYAMTH